MHTGETNTLMNNNCDKIGENKIKHHRKHLLFRVIIIYFNILVLIMITIFILHPFYTKMESHTSLYNDVCSKVLQNTNNTRIEINQTVPEIDELEHLFKNKRVKIGGKWSPLECEPLYRVAIIVPYRNRENQLKLFLKHMHPFLMRQQLDYGIYLIEPTQNLTFNRGLLLNIGFVEANEDSYNHWDCYVFHDVDLLPEDDRNYYFCPPGPRLLSSAVSTFDYKLPYEDIFGGVSIMTKKQFNDVNGYSNYFFGWGGEDDDISNRIRKKSGFNISRYPLETGRYTMLQHKKEIPGDKRIEYVRSGESRFDTDGLNSLKYEVLKIEKFKLYAKVCVSYNKSEIIKG